MNFLKANTTWTNAEFIPFKLCIASAYVIIGSHFHSSIKNHLTLLLFLFTASVIITLYLWFSKMNAKKPNA